MNRQPTVPICRILLLLSVWLIACTESTVQTTEDDALSFLEAVEAADYHDRGSTRAVLRSLGVSESTRVTSVIMSERLPIVPLRGMAASGGPDPECEWKKGDSKEEVDEFEKCWAREEEEGCDGEDDGAEFKWEFNDDDESELVLIHVHCDNEN